MAACKINGRRDRAYTLASQVLAASWPLPNNALLGPRILSDGAHAPYLGEACMLFFLTQQPATGVPITTGGFTPAFVYLAYGFYFGVGILILVSAALRFKRGG